MNSLVLVTPKNNSNKMTIEVTQKEVYGNTLTYVADESVRNSIKKLTGRKTLTDYDIEALKELGFVLVLKQITANI
jgi:predicted nucleotidyltransferase